MQSVKHAVYGIGEVQQTRFGGFEISACFEDGIVRWVRRDEIEFLSGSTPAPNARIAGSVEPILPEERFRARKIIESLRLGIVSHGQVNEFTFGRDYAITQINEWLNVPGSGPLIVSGEYGVGKTHLLDYTYSSALKRNWAVALVALDPGELPLHKPKAIYEAIVRSFKFRTHNGGFREFLREIAASPKWHELQEHEYLGTVIEKIRTGEDDEQMYEWIEGESTHKPQMYNYSTCGNIYCYILSGIGWAAKNILGLDGFLILFDEAESVDSFWHTTYQNNKSWNFLKGLVLAGSDDSVSLKEVSMNKFYKHSLYKGWWGYHSDLQYCGRLRLPFTWRIPCNLKILFAFTPNDEMFEIEPLKSARKFEIGGIGAEYFENISEKIISLYDLAYNFQADPRVFEYVPKDNTRRFIKGLVEALDLTRFHPDTPTRGLLDV
ncbi:MAG: BREX system ATP-binding domain-containing protein [Euryarchaeota archaeon]|nr:BREX system ATP-binding domain-containing protein [Euryarchaeota archaeon]